ncbi:MAG: pbpE 4 [Acidobacteria bacterium]|nr:pbpE 4 [Acidobacteriota bacterium]
MRSRLILAVPVVVAALAAAAAAQAPPTSSAGDAARYSPPRFTDPGRREKLARAFEEIDRLVAGDMARQHVPGAAWGVVVDGELAHVGAAGTRVAGTEAPVDGDTVFRIASMTKSFTAMAVLALRDEGRLSLDDPVERYVPELRELRYPTADSPRITVRHLLSHAAGFPEDNPWGDQQLSATEDELTAMLRRGISFSNPPGLAYEYSNLGFAILGRVVSRVSGVAYRDYVTARVLRPLGMASTTLDPSAVAPERLAHGYRWEDGRWTEEPQLPDGAFGSMGGMLTSVRDLSRYVAAFLAAWPPRDGPETLPVRRASLREMQQVSRAEPAQVSVQAAAGAGAVRLRAGGYGFGLQVDQTCEFDHVVTHGGGLPGFGSLMRWLPEYGVGFVAVGNRTYTGWGGVANQVFALLAKTGGLQPRAVQPSPALVAAKDAVSHLVASWDDEVIERIAAVNLFRDRSKDRRRAEVEALRGQLGSCRADEAFDYVENALRGEWLLRCERGQARASVTLAPTVPPAVQDLEIRAVRPGGEGARRSSCPK